MKDPSHKDRDSVGPSSENIMAALDLPSNSPSPSLVGTDGAIAGPSWRSLDAENTGDRPPRSSNGQYDIV